MSSDEALFEAYRRNGDRDALDALFRRHIDGVYRTTRRILRNDADAQDATQAAFLNVLRHSETRKEGMSFGGWLYRIAVNAALQRAKSRKDRSLPTPSSEDPSVKKELSQAVQQVVDRLPEEYRLPILLHYYEGQSYERIAETLDCPKGTVGTRLSRGIEKLRALLAACGLTLTVAALVAAMRESEAVSAPPALVEAVSQAARTAPLPTAPSPARWLPGGKFALIASVVMIAGTAAVLRLARDPAHQESRRGHADSVRPSQETPGETSDGPRALAVNGSREEKGRRGVITGRVLGPGGQPLAGARVSADDGKRVLGMNLGIPAIFPEEVSSLVPPSDASPFLNFRRATTETDSEGRYRIVPDGQLIKSFEWSEGPSVLLVIRASHPTTAMGTVFLKAGRLDSDLEVPDLTLPMGGTLAGRVVDEQDRPISGVSLFLQISPSSVMAEAIRHTVTSYPSVGLTDGQGRFALQRVPPGEFHLAAGGKGYLLAIQKVRVEDGGRTEGIEFRLAPGRALEGIVRDRAGAPIPDATIQLLSTEGMQRTPSDDGGRFRFDGLPQDLQQGNQLIVCAAGFATKWITVNPKATSVAITLAKPGRIAGRLVDRASRRPVESARAYWAYDSSTTRGRDVPVAFEGDGRFFVTGYFDTWADGAQHVRIRAEGFAERLIGPVQVSGDETSDVGVVELDPGVSVRGQVLDPTGKPLSAATTALALPGVTFSPFSSHPPEEPDRAQSLEDGSFVIPSIEPGQYELLVWHENFPPLRLPAAVGSDGLTIRIQMKEGGRVRGRVSGAPDESYVQLTLRGEARRFAIAKDGTYRSDLLPEGSYEIELRGDRSALRDDILAQGTVIVVPGVESTWDPEAVALLPIQGRAFAEDGSPAQGFTVMLFPETASRMWETKCDADGRFAFQDVAPGRYQVAVFLSSAELVQGGCFATVELHQGQTYVEVRLPARKSAVQGRLLDAQRRPVASTELKVVQAGETDLHYAAGTATTREDGSFKVERLAAGAYDLWGPGGDEREGRLLHRFVVREGETLDLGTVILEK